MQVSGAKALRRLGQACRAPSSASFRVARARAPQRSVIISAGAHRTTTNGTASTASTTNGRQLPWLATLEAWHSSQGAVRSLPEDSRLHDHVPHVDAVVMLAGGLTADGGAPPWVSRRLDLAAAIRAVQLEAGAPDCPILCLGGGTPHKPPILCRRSGHVIHESTSCADYLMEMHGVPPSSILKETSSYDTVGNSLFSLTIHAIPAGWRRVAVVTSHFHMPRTVALFTHMWGCAARDVWREPDRYQLLFASATDEGIWPDDVLQARRDKEAASTRTWLDNARRLPTLASVHQWMYQTHQCYAVPRQHEFSLATITDKRLLESY